MPFPYDVNSPDKPTHRVTGGKQVPYTEEEKLAKITEWNIEAQKILDDQWRQNRENDFGEQLSIIDQLEALLEDRLGNPAKLNILLAKYQEIKVRYPKP